MVDSWCLLLMIDLGSFWWSEWRGPLSEKWILIQSDISSVNSDGCRGEKLFGVCSEYAGLIGGHGFQRGNYVLLIYWQPSDSSNAKLCPGIFKHFSSMISMHFQRQCPRIIGTRFNLKYISYMISGFIPNAFHVLVFVWELRRRINRGPCGGSVTEFMPGVKSPMHRSGKPH